jgi:signal transduction histidine kinase
MTGYSVLKLVPPERRDEAEQNRLLLNSGGSVESYETERLRKDGTRVPVVMTISPLRNRAREIVGASVIARDISLQRQSEEAVRRSEKLASAGRLAASIAHEINNPLEAVLNLLYLARNNPRQATQYLNMAEQEVIHVARLAQQTLGLVRHNPPPARMDPARIMDEILDLYARKIETKKIIVSRRYRGDAQINGYPGEVRQLLTNLLVNAVDAMDHAGTVQIRVSGAQEWSSGRDGVRITLADNGSGISSENLSRIFEPFYTTKKEAGTGLGLWVSHGIVQKHAGSIRVRSCRQGQRRGTVFSIFLPSGYAASQVA